MQPLDIKILMVSSDRKILVPNEAVALRMKEYGQLVQELHIVLLSDKSHRLRDTQIDKNIWVYPTNSTNKFLRSLDAVRIGKRIVRDKKFIRGKSVITTQDPAECGWVGVKIKRQWRIPLEVQLHTDLFSPYFSGFLNHWRQRIARKVLRQADGVRVVSEHLRSEVRGLTKADIQVLPIYINREIYEKKLSFDLRGRFGWSFIMLTVGRLSSEKNLSLALEVLAQVRKKYPNTGLVIVGSGPEEARLKSLARELKIDRHVSFEGWQTNLVSYYQTADMYLQTSLYEGYGMALVEAGLSDLPIITTAVGLALEFEHGRQAYVYEPEAIENFTAGVIDLIENKSKGENLVSNMQKFLGDKLVSKEEYLNKLQTAWNSTASKIY